MLTKLLKIFIRYFPPGLLLTIREDNGKTLHRTVEFPGFHKTTVEDLWEYLVTSHSWVARHKDHIIRLIKKIKNKHKSSTATDLIHDKCLSGHLLPLTKCSLTKDGDLCVTGSYDRTARVWDLNSGTCIGTLRGHNDIVYDAAIWESDKTFIATGSFDGTVRYWSMSEGKLNPLLVLSDHESPITVVKVFTKQEPDYFLTSASMDGTIGKWDLEIGETESIWEEHEAPVTSVTYNKHKQQLFSTSFDGTIRIWDLRCDKSTKVLNLDYCQVNCGEPNANGNYFVAGGTDAQVTLWDLRNLAKPAHILTHDAEVNTVKWDRTGTMVVSSSLDGTARLTNTNFQNMDPLEGHHGDVTLADFDATSQHVVTCGEDGRIISWDIANGQIIQDRRHHNGPINDMKIGTLGDVIVTCGSDAMCHVWNPSRNNESS